MFTKISGNADPKLSYAVEVRLDIIIAIATGIGILLQNMYMYIIMYILAVV